MNDFVADQDGYLQVFVAYESGKPVWFDDLKISHQPALVVQENHYYPFGMNVTSLEKQGVPQHRWQFNGIEKTEEFDLNWYGYKYRKNYDVQISRFFSVDPISDNYVYLTPYQHSSNNPISMIELEGLEGVRYTEFYTDKKGQEQNRHVIEADIYIGVGGNGYSNSDVYKITQNLNKEYNRFNPKKGESNYFKVGGQEVRFQFNVKTFNSDKTSLADFATELQSKSKVETSSPKIGGDGKPVVIKETGKTINEEAIVGAAIGLDASIEGQGATVINKVGISPTADDRRHTEAHELGHFFLYGSPKNPRTDKEHDYAGGVFKYEKKDSSNNIVQSTESVNKQNIKDILENVPIKKKEK